MMLIRPLLLIPLLVLAAAGQQRDSLPEFSLTTLKGETLQTKELKYKIVVLDFWATWCENCVSEIPELNKLEKEYGSRGVKVIGLAVQSGWASDIQKFVKQVWARCSLAIYLLLLASCLIRLWRSYGIRKQRV